MDGTMQDKRRNNNTGKAMYGISRIDSDRFRAHAKAYRDELVAKYPPLSRRELCTTLRSNNRSGITGVYRYAKCFTLKNGQVKQNWYWEATWPIGNSQQSPTRPGATLRNPNKRDVTPRAG